MGLPLIGLKKQAQDGLSAYQPIPVTAFLKIQGGLAELTDGSAAASLEALLGL